LSITAFFFANNIIPKAEYEFVNLRKTIVQQKPSMAITEGQFNKVGDYNIKVDKKYGDNGNLLDNVTIHKISKLGTGVSTVIKSDRGELMSSEQSNFLQMVLFDGYYYENLETRNPNDRNKQLFAKSSFKKYIINFDLAPLENMDSNEDKIANTNTMLNVNELRYTLDSLEKNRKKEILSFTDNIHQKQTVVNSPLKKETAPRVKDTLKKDILSFLTDQEKVAVLELAKSNITNTKYSIEGSKSEFEGKSKNINNHWLALYEKFVIAYGCLLMFFIGAPLGAIIRKGGLGLPIVFAMLIFIIFHFINVFGKKIAQEDGLPPFMGAWMSSFVLTPLAVLLTYRATNDIGLINMDAILQPIYKFTSRVFVSTKTKKE
jgi:lipopolysaccharide export system permease protein